MNEQAFRRPPTRAAEGLPRWRWTLAEFDRFIEVGLLTESDRVELIGGELIPMAAKGVRHENLRADLVQWLHDHVPASARVVTELGWRPDGETYCEPDILVLPRSVKSVSTAPAAGVLLLVEIADTTLHYDTGTKARLYARLGVREYWVIDTTKLVTRVHRGPNGDEGYGSVEEMPGSSALGATLAPELLVRLADFDAGLSDVAL